MSPAFERYIGIDYSGAETPKSSLKGLRVYAGDRLTAPQEVPPPPSPRKYWTRRKIAQWLVEKLSESSPTLVGIDHGFSFPLRYFEQHGLPLDWPSFLDDFQRHWPTDENIYVDFVRDGITGSGAARSGNSRWRRITELPAKSVFHFDFQGTVAKSTHAGIRWLRYVRLNVQGCVHIWPFDGWTVPLDCSVVAEVYPSLWSGSFRARNERPTSKTPLLLQSGCAVRIRTEVSNSSSPLSLDPASARPPRLRDGFSAWSERRSDSPTNARSLVDSAHTDRTRRY
jgi:hypothetical protein